jgi:hypothetical protein
MKYRGRNRHIRLFLGGAILLSVALVLSGCPQAQLVGLLDGDDGQPLAISPQTTVVVANEVVTFEASGGHKPYTYSKLSGEGVIDADTGVFTAPGSTGTTVLEVADRAGNGARATVEVVTPGTYDVDYAAGSISHGSGTTAGEAVTGSFTFTNQGTDGGTHSIEWQVYASTNATLDIGADYVIAGGTEAQLAAGATSPAIPFSGTWPTTADTYYLILRLLTGPDDFATSNNTVSDGGTVVAGPAPPEVNYQPSNVLSTGDTVSGRMLSGSFDLGNVGTEAGTENGIWSVYVSPDTTIDAGTDPLVDSGNLSALAAGDTQTGITFAGTWPDTAGSYYLLVSVSYTDDVDTANNTAASAAVPVDPPDVDYVATIATPVSSPAGGGSSISESFTITNQGTDGGSVSVSWTSYVSTDATVSGDDDPIDLGSIGSLGAGSTSAAINIDAGTWPVVASTQTYYLLVEVSAADEPTGNTANNEASEGFSIIRPDVDYVVTGLTNTGTPAGTGSAISESLTIQNQGTDPGGSTVNWDVYASSDTVLQAGDTPVASGTVGALGAGASSGPIAVTGSWPTESGEYYLLARVSAADESETANNEGASGVFEVNSADVDYIVTDVSSSFTTVTTGSAISETFSYKNAGNVSGTQPVTYNAYASTDAVLDGSDIPVGSGSVAALGAGAGASGIAVDGSWPGTAGTYYLIIELAAPDESVTGNNTGYDGTFAVNDPPDYTVTSTSFPVVAYGGNPGELFSNASGAHGGAPTHSFVIGEQVGAPGQQAIQWRLYQSSDEFLDAGDTEIASGTHPALSAGGSTPAIPVDEALPATWGYYYYIVTIAAGDDANPTNDTETLGPVLVWQSSGNAESDISEDDILLSQGDDFAVLLNPGDSVTFDGLMDENGLRDSFIVHTGPDVVDLAIVATWSTSGDDINVDVYDGDGSYLDSSLSAANDREPGIGSFLPAGISANGRYYIDAISSANAADEGTPYVLTVTGQ